MSLIPVSEVLVIGIRNPQERTIYPLSWHDMKKLQTLFFSVMSGCVSLSETGYTQEQVYQYILGRIGDNLQEILNMVVEGDPIDEKEISFEQATEVGMLIYKMNFEAISKNVKGLLQKMVDTKKAQNPKNQ